LVPSQNSIRRHSSFSPCFGYENVMISFLALDSSRVAAVYGLPLLFSLFFLIHRHPPFCSLSLKIVAGGQLSPLGLGDISARLRIHLSAFFLLCLPRSGAGGKFILNLLFFSGRCKFTLQTFAHLPLLLLLGKRGKSGEISLPATYTIRPPFQIGRGFLRTHTHLGPFFFPLQKRERFLSFFPHTIIFQAGEGRQSVGCLSP